MEIQDLISENEPLTSLPNTFYLLQDAMDDPNSDFARIGKIISIDPALPLRLLKVVNSAFYGYSNQIETVSHALGVVGTEQLIQLVLATSVVSQYKGISKDMINNVFPIGRGITGFSADHLVNPLHSQLFPLKPSQKIVFFNPQKIKI